MLIVWEINNILTIGDVNLCNWGGGAKINGIHYQGPWNVHHGHIEYLEFFKLCQIVKVQDLGDWFFREFKSKKCY